MTRPAQPDSPAVAEAIYRLYRDFFDQAEKKRRWSLRDDIPWDQCNKALNPAIADVVESFCAVELYLPDYLGKNLPQIRGERGPAWFMFNWGYEESKHSLALGDWLRISGMRSEEQMADLERASSSTNGTCQWTAPWAWSAIRWPRNWPPGCITAICSRHIGPQGDPALHKLLSFVSIDERAAL